MRILLIDDDPAVRDLVSSCFEDAGHRVEWRSAGTQGLREASHASYDAIILDVRMPGLDGLGVLKTFRQAGKRTPVLMLTSARDEEDIIDALEIGADGYMTKPFSPAELVARVKALCRRAEERDTYKPTALSWGDLRVDHLARTATRAGKSLRLTNIEFEILSMLMIRPEELVTREALLLGVWNLGEDPGTGIVHVHMSNLREKLSASGSPDLIRTVRGKGYLIEGLDSPEK